MIDASVVFAGDGPPEARRISAICLSGSGDGPRALLQAGLHADEIPPMLVLHRLLPMLRAATTQGRLRGHITVVPQANPIGLRQVSHGRLLGRFDAATGRNFNRAFDPAAIKPAPGVAAWQAALLTLAARADIVLDLHTDDEALPYVYLHQALWPAAADLPSLLGSAAAIIWNGDGGGAFEEAIVSRWLSDSRGVTGRLAATVELRGQADVDNEFARSDAEALFRLLCHRDVIAGETDVGSWQGVPVPIAHMQTIRVRQPGIVVFTQPLGALLAAGQPFARFVPHAGDPDADIDLVAPQPGTLLTRTRERYLPAGGIVAKLTGDAVFQGSAGGPLDD